MTTRTSRPSDPEELRLFLPLPRDWLPEDHPVYFLADLVEGLTLTPILATYGEMTRGTARDYPQLLVTVLLYTYVVWIPASWQIARKLEDDSTLGARPSPNRYSARPSRAVAICNSCCGGFGRCVENA